MLAISRVPSLAQADFRSAELMTAAQLQVFKSEFQKYKKLNPANIKAGNADCDAAISSYMACFRGENLIRCRTKFDVKACKTEYDLAKNDIFLLLSARTATGTDYCIQIIAIAERNVPKYKSAGWCS